MLHSGIQEHSLRPKHRLLESELNASSYPLIYTEIGLRLFVLPEYAHLLYKLSKSINVINNINFLIVAVNF